MPAQKLASSRDEQMPDAGEGKFQYEDEGIALNGPRKTDRKIIVLSQAENAATFAIEHEDHTLGNALRWMIMKNPAVELCGYSIPHPAEDRLQIRIQTYGIPPIDALETGLDDLMNLCDVVSEKFEKARHEFDQKSQP